MPPAPKSPPPSATRKAPKAKGAESQNVTDLREKIKSFLASQGMIKGHSGPSQRGAPNAEETPEERATLKLASEGYPSSASESPPGNLLVLSNEDGIRHTQVSNVRGEDGPWGQSPFPTGSNYEAHPILHHSPQTNTRQESPPFNGYQEQQYDPSLMTHNSTTIAPSSWTSIPHIAPINSALIPIHGSTFGPSYSYAPGADEYIGFSASPDTPSPPSYTIHLGLPTHGANDEWIQRYVAHKLMDKQYQLADDPINKIILESIQSGTARASASFLATVYFQRKQFAGKYRALGDMSIQEKYAQLEGVLQKGQHDNNDALGALNVISAFLFDGGFGEWQGWLELAVKQSMHILKTGRYMNLKDALINCTGVEQFIVKTTIWFDVLASVTTMRLPSLDEPIQELFNPSQASVHEVTSSGATSLSMMTVMGCEGRIIWAIAQISRLANMKQAYADRGALDTQMLVRRMAEIDTHLEPPDDSLFAGEEVHRVYTSEVFRNATRLYLYTVVHGDFPNVFPIRKAVEDTFAALKRARDYNNSVGQIVLRSTVFAVFMIGCLCKDRDSQQRMFSQLSDGDEETVYGNYKGVTEVMDAVWAERARSKAKDPVPWRQKLHETRLLLV
ncbi:hypothetical protein V5O48_002937 [Marasmius crinis-equi]|uniref:Uncharacterized protein n=1 Tax=Marasmius crinis-equi TaxID=585013 RepID=A0ABR3FUJ0_9AGAR